VTPNGKLRNLSDSVRRKTKKKNLVKRNQKEDIKLATSASDLPR
jgi:hypothetical protein